MQEYWELYMKNLEGKPASILFNAGISMEVATIRYIYPQIAFIKVKLQEPNERELLSESEQPDISFLEDKLEASLIKFRIGKYVGRIISDGHVTFLYYLQFTYNWQDFLNYALKEFEHYEIKSGYQEDEAWNYYHKLLYPTAKEWQIIQNHKVCDILRTKEDILEVPRAIEHKLFMSDEDKKEKIIHALEADGFGIMDEMENEEGIKGLNFYRVDKPFYTDMDELTLYLIDMLEKHQASYDGWETSVVKG